MRQPLLRPLIINSLCCLSLCLPCSVLAQAPDAPQPIEVRALVGQTGASMEFGRNELNAYTLAVEEWNARGGIAGKRVRLLVEDTQTNQTKMITAFQRLAARGAPVVLGPTWLDGFQGLIPIARKRSTLLVTPSAAPESFGGEDREWPISFYHNSTTETKGLLSFLKARGLSRFALIYEEGPFAQLLRRVTLESGMTPVGEISAQTGEVDFQAAVLKLRAAKPDCVILYLWDDRSLFAALKQLRVFLPTARLATVHDGISWIKKESLAAVLPSLFYTEFELADPSFISRYRARFKEEPQLTASNAYDAMNAVLTGLANGHNNASTLRDFLRSTEISSVTFGAFRFSAAGQVPSRIAVREFMR